MGAARTREQFFWFSIEDTNCIFDLLYLHRGPFLHVRSIVFPRETPPADGAASHRLRFAGTSVERMASVELMAAGVGGDGGGGEGGESGEGDGRAARCGRPRGRRGA